MFLKILCMLILVPLLEANTSFVQDPTKVESKHYKLAFENERVQVVYVHYGPHEKSVMHQHPAGVVVNLTNGHLRFTDQKGVAQEVYAIRGEARWFPALKHKVENLSDVTFDGVYIGVKGDATTIISKAAPLSVGGPILSELAEAEDEPIEKMVLVKMPTEIPLTSDNHKVASWVWHHLVPKSGQSDTVQGELLRSIEKLRWEAQNNGNQNWDTGFEKLINFLESTLGNEQRFTEEARRSIQAEGGTVHSNEDNGWDHADLLRNKRLFSPDLHRDAQAASANIMPLFPGRDNPKPVCCLLRDN